MKKLLFFLLLCSCMSTQQLMNSWIGHTKGDLIMSWGPPSTTYSDHSVGEILIYAKQQSIPSSTTWSDNATAYTTQGSSWWEYKMFYIQNGKIYSWRTSNQQIPPQQIDVRLFIQ